MSEIIANTADELFDKTVEELCKHSVDLGNDIYVAHEMINAHLVLTDPTHNTMCNSKRKMPIRYAIGELMWYLSRNRTADAIAPFSKFWQKIAEEDGTVNSNYGWCIFDKYNFDQWLMVKRLLIKNPASRQAVIHIKEARDLASYPTKDVNCTLTLQFFVRNGKLDLIVNMRSNDIWLGLPYDLFNFTCMQILMAMELGIEVGTYYHNAGSLHMYTRDVEKLEANSDNT